MPSPADVPEKKERTCAWVLYVVLLSVFLGYVIWTIADGVQAREDPPTSFEREDNVWRLPHVVAEGVAPIVGQCTFSLATDDDDVERECRSEFFADEESDSDEGVIVFFLGDFDIEAMRDEYEENAAEDDPEFDQSFVEGFVVLGFEEVGELWEVPIGLCSQIEFDELEEVNYGTILDVCPINTYVPVGPVEEGVASRAFASNFVLEAEVFRTLEGDEEYTYSSSVSSTIWAIPAGEYDDEFSLLSTGSAPLSSARKHKKVSADSEKAVTHGAHKRHHGKKHHPLPHVQSRGVELQQTDPLAYVGQVWLYQHSWEISATEEVDPLDPLALIGQWGGAFTYVAIVFGLVFVAGKGGARYNRFSKDSREKYKRTPASKKKDEKKKKKKGKKEEDDDDDDEDDDDGEDDDDEDDDDEGISGRFGV